MRFGCVQYARNNIRDELHQPLVLIVCEVALQDVDMQSVGLWNRYLSFLSQEDGWGGIMNLTWLSCSLPPRLSLLASLHQARAFSATDPDLSAVKVFFRRRPSG